MTSQEAETMRWMNIQIMLTADQVANEILRAVTEDRRDLTLAPNPEIALALQIMKEDPDQAEMLVGESFQRQLARQQQQ